MRTVNISTDVFAAIWARRKHGEETEDAILRRELGCKPANESAKPQPAPATEGGVLDNRNGVLFPEGFRIFRTYKGREYSAEAKAGAWVRSDNGIRYSTLNQLNGSIAAGAENVWNGTWKYRTSDNAIRSIDDLRG